MMMMITTPLFALVFVFAAASMSSDAHLTMGAHCNDMCTFRLCRSSAPDVMEEVDGEVVLRSSRTAAYPFICRSFPRGRELGKILRTGEASVSSAGLPSVPISKWRPQPPLSLTAKFPKRFFRAFSIPLAFGLQGVGTLNTKGNQDDFLDDLCVTLPITSYEVRVMKKRKSKVFVSKAVSSSDCVSFETRTPAVVVDITWNTPDNVQLSVTNPKGSEGIPLKGNDASKCFAGQRVVIFEAARRGTYKISYTVVNTTIRHGTGSPHSHGCPKWWYYHFFRNPVNPTAVITVTFGGKRRRWKVGLKSGMRTFTVRRNMKAKSLTA